MREQRSSAASLPPSSPAPAEREIEPALDVSIVIPSFNARTVLEACLESIYMPEPSRLFEILVVNDASTDGTPEMVREKFPRVRLLDNRVNLGYSLSTNRAIEAARGRFVLFLNSDVVLGPGAIDSLAEHLASHPEVGAAGCLLFNPDGSIQASVKALPSFASALFGARSFVSRFWPDNPFTRRELLHWKAKEGSAFPAGYISTASLMVPRDLLRELGNLDPDFFHFADADLCKRIWDAKRSVVCVPKAAAVHDAHRGGSMASLRRRLRSVASFHQGAYRYFRKHSSTSSWHPMNAVVASGLALRFFVSVGLQLAKELGAAIYRTETDAVGKSIRWQEPATAKRASSEVDVSIVVPNYNARAMLESCLESVYAHSWAPSFELLVVDDESSDGSSDMVRDRFPAARLYVNERNLGYGGSCNLAIAEARGRYVYLLNNDVELLPGVVDTLVDFMDAHPDAGAAGSLLFNSDGSIQRSVKAHPSFRSAVFGARSYLSHWFPSNRFTRAELLHWKANEGLPFSAGYVSSASLMVRREEFARVGDLDTKLTYFNDADFCRRLWKYGRSVYYVPQARAIHHDHQGGTRVTPRRRFLSVLEFHFGAFRYYRKHSGKPLWHPVNLVVVGGLAWRLLPCILIQTLRELSGPREEPSLRPTPRREPDV